MPKIKDWRDAASFGGTYWGWARRARFAVGMLGSERYVCDLGCGEQPLRWFLPRDRVYLPADLVARTPNVEECDLNAGRFPRHALSVCEIVVMLGVITHLSDPELVLRALAEQVETLLISYNAADLRPDRPEFWRNAFTREGLIALLAECGFIAIAGRRYGSQIVLKAISRRFDDRARTRRALAQSAFDPPGETWSDGICRTYHRARTWGTRRG